MRRRAGEPGFVGEAVGDILGSVVRDTMMVWRWGSARRERARNDRNAAETERKALAQHQKWLQAVTNQMARGKAGDASPEEAAAALRGRGGRPNKLDEKWF